MKEFAHLQVAGLQEFWWHIFECLGGSSLRPCEGRGAAHFNPPSRNHQQVQLPSSRPRAAFLPIVAALVTLNLQLVLNLGFEPLANAIVEVVPPIPDRAFAEEFIRTLLLKPR